MMNMKLLAVVTSPYIYHGSSSWKTFWEEILTLGEFTSVNMKICVCRNVRKHIEIKGSDKYVKLDISLKFDNLDKMRITSSGSKDNLVRSGKGLITSLGIMSKSRPKKCKSPRYAIGNISKNTFQRLLGIFRIYLKRVMRGGDPNMSLMTVTFTYQDIF